MNGRSALMTVGFQFPYGDIDGVDRDDETKVITFGVSIKRAILGLQLGIAVQISGDGVVTMNIVPTITRIQEEADVELPTSTTTVQAIKIPSSIFRNWPPPFGCRTERPWYSPD